MNILKTIEKYKLEVAVFVCGAIVMVFELVGSRVVAPYLGTSIYIWTSIIGVILGSLSFGYYLGGKISDKGPSFRDFSKVIFFSAIAIGAVFILKDAILMIFTNLRLRLDVAALFSSLVLFAPASILLGIISPYAVRLKISDIKYSGSTVGNLYAISTIGSIVGTFGAGFFLLGFFGNANLLIIMSAILVLTAILVDFKTKETIAKLFFLFLLLVFAFILGQGAKAAEENGYVDVDSQYSRIIIGKGIYNGQPILSLATGPRATQCAMFLDKEGIVFDYIKFYRMARYFKPSIDSALMIGACNYSYPNDFLASFPSSRMDVVEIDPKMTELAKKYFNLKDNERMRIFHEDARIFLNENKEKYDVIFSDAFGSGDSIPYQLTTIEAIKNEYRSLNDGGVLLVNIIGSIEGEGSKFLRAEYGTYKQVFPQVYLFPVKDAGNGSQNQNIMLLAIKSDKVPDFKSADPEISGFLSHLWKGDIKTDLPALTDDFAPVEYYEKDRHI